MGPGQSSRQAMLFRINNLQENLFSKNRYFPEHKLTRGNAMQSLQSICTEDQSEYGSAILNQYKLAIRSPAPDEKGIIQDYETLLMRCTTDQGSRQEEGRGRGRGSQDKRESDASYG